MLSWLGYVFWLLRIFLGYCQGVMIQRIESPGGPWGDLKILQVKFSWYKRSLWHPTLQPPACLWSQPWLWWTRDACSDSGSYCPTSNVHLDVSFLCPVSTAEIQELAGPTFKGSPEADGVNATRTLSASWGKGSGWILWPSALGWAALEGILHISRGPMCNGATVAQQPSW